MTQMRRYTAAGAMILAAVATTVPASAQETPPSFAPVAKDLLPAVVNISTQKTVEGGPQMPLEQLPEGHPLREFFERFGGGQRQAPRQMRSLGSGFIIDDAGYIITNQHVVKKADKVTVVLRDKTRLDAKIVGTDKATDLALLKVSTKKDLPEVDWGNSEKAQIGDWALAIGNPFGLGGSVTAGIISARGRDQGRSLQPLHPDRHGDQPGQLRRTAVQRGRQGDRRQHGDPLAQRRQRRRRVRAAVQGCQTDHRRTPPDGEVTRGWLGVMVQPITPQLAQGLKSAG